MTMINSDCIREYERKLRLPEHKAKVACGEFQRRDPKHQYEVVCITGRGTSPGFDLLGAISYGIIYQVVRRRRFS
jgi:hypothetical protein